MMINQQMVDSTFKTFWGEQIIASNSHLSSSKLNNFWGAILRMPMRLSDKERNSAEHDSVDLEIS